MSFQVAEDINVPPYQF